MKVPDLYWKLSSFFTFITGLIIWVCFGGTITDPTAGGTVTEPFALAEIRGSISNHNGQIAKVFIFDESDAYSVYLETQTDESGNYIFEDVGQVSGKFRILIDQSGLNGYLSESYDEKSISEFQFDNQSSTANSYQLPSIELKAYEDVKVHIPSLNGSEIQKAQQAYSVLEPIITGDHITIKSLQNQNQLSLEYSDGSNLELILEDTQLEQIQGDAQLGASRTHLNSEDIYLALDFNQVSSKQYYADMGDSLGVIDGDKYSSVTGVDGNPNGALYLDSSIFTIPLPKGVLDDDFWSISFWVKPECPEQFYAPTSQNEVFCGVLTIQDIEDTTSAIVQPDREFSYRFESYTSLLRGENSMDEQLFQDDVSPNKTWTHIHYQYQAGKPQELYINGVKQLQIKFTIPRELDHSRLQSTGKYLKIGYSWENYWNAINPFYTGAIDQLRLWKRSLSEKEIQELAVLPEKFKFVSYVEQN